MIFNGIEKDYIVPLTGRRRSAWAPISRNLITVTGMPGAHLSHTDVQVRVITVPVLVRAENIEDLQKTKEDMAEWLVHDEPKELVFKDEPDRVYYAVVDGELELDEIFSTGRGEITFICPDPFKYGHEKVIEPSSDTFIVENEGTAEAEPIIELTAKEKVTFAMISNSEEYNLVGVPASVDTELVDTRTLLFEERGATLNEWTSQGTAVDGGNVSGQFGYDGTGITVASHGTGERWHGPAVMREITPVQDFEVEMICQGITDAPDDTFRMEFYLYDEYFNVLGKMAVLDNDARLYRIKAEGRIGPFLEHFGSNYLITEQNYSYHGGYFYGILRFRRVGNRFELYVTRLDNNLRHINSYTASYIDTNNQYAGRLRYVQIHTGMFAGTQNPYSSRINMIRVYELAQVMEDQTTYIAYPGDVITFDHVTKDIRLNGESRKDLKAFGGSFFTLKKGTNALTVTPENVFNTKITYRERYK